MAIKAKVVKSSHSIFPIMLPSSYKTSHLVNSIINPQSQKAPNAKSNKNIITGNKNIDLLLIIKSLAIYIISAAKLILLQEITKNKSQMPAPTHNMIANV